MGITRKRYSLSSSVMGTECVLEPLIVMYDIDGTLKSTSDTKTLYRPGLDQHLSDLYHAGVRFGVFTAGCPTYAQSEAELMFASLNATLPTDAAPQPEYFYSRCECIPELDVVAARATDDVKFMAILSDKIDKAVKSNQATKRAFNRIFNAFELEHVCILKPLSRVREDTARVLLIEDKWENGRLNRANTIVVPEFSGDYTDTVLTRLSKHILAMVDVCDVRVVDQGCFTLSKAIRRRVKSYDADYVHMTKAIAEYRAGLTS